MNHSDDVGADGEFRGIRLQGKIGEEEKTFDLTAGEYTVGSSGASDLCLRVQGVSREHAVIRVLAETLVVEDRGSTNGTFVSGARVERAEAAPGVEIGFGPVAMKVGQIGSEERHLALVLEEVPGETDSSATASQVDTAHLSRVGGVGGHVPRRWLDLLERIEELSDADRDRAATTTTALASLRELLEVDGVAMATWHGPLAVVLHADGRVGQLPDRAAVREQLAALGGGSVSFRVADIDCTVAAVAGAGETSTPTLLVAWGSGEGEPARGQLLRLVLRRLLVLEGQIPATASTAAATSELRFPEGYRRGTSPAALAVYRQLKVLIRGTLPVLVVGETGVGKEVVAQTLHRSSERARKAFVALNCAAIPAELQEAELFGIGAGVATGVRPREGAFQRAAGGVLFLDEVGEMSAALQTKLLRALQTYEIQPVGGTPTLVDVRIVAATNADLGRLVASGDFRSDLYFRLAGFVLELPSLRACPEDIPGLVEHFLRRFSRELGKRVRGVTTAAMRRLQAYPWPGNVRELENEMRRATYLLGAGLPLGKSTLSPHVLAAGHRPAELNLAAPLALEPQLERLELDLVRRALEQANGVQLQAARLLGIHRNSLARKIARLGLGAC